MELTSENDAPLSSQAQDMTHSIVIRVSLRPLCDSMALRATATRALWHAIQCLHMGIRLSVDGILTARRWPLRTIDGLDARRDNWPTAYAKQRANGLSVLVDPYFLDGAHNGEFDIGR